jgi:hypothetical protein
MIKFFCFHTGLWPNAAFIYILFGMDAFSPYPQICAVLSTRLLFRYGAGGRVRLFALGWHAASSHIKMRLARVESRDTYSRNLAAFASHD